MAQAPDRAVPAPQAFRLEYEAGSELNLPLSVCVVDPAETIGRSYVVAGLSPLWCIRQVVELRAEFKLGALHDWKGPEDRHIVVPAAGTTHQVAAGIAEHVGAGLREA